RVAVPPSMPARMPPCPPPHPPVPSPAPPPRSATTTPARCAMDCAVCSWLSARPRKSRTSPDRAPERSSPAPSAEPALPQPAPSRCRAISIHRQRPPIIGRGPLSYPSLAEAADDTAHEIVLEAVEPRPELAEAQCVDQSDDGDPDGHGPQDGLVRAVEAELLEALAQRSEGRPGSLGCRTEPRLPPHGPGSGGTVSGLCDQLHESDHGTRARHDGLL